MSFTVLNKYKDRWILTSAERVEGEGTIDAPPVRLVQHGDRKRLAEVLRGLLAEEHPFVPEPDWNDRSFIVGIRVEAVGLKSWRAFMKEARAFKVQEQPDGLLLEEWPKEGGSFSAKPSWRKRFPPNAIEELVDYLVKKTKPVAGKAAAPRRKAGTRARRS